MDSIEHLEVYINIIRSYLKEKGREAGKPITDFTNFEIFLSHDKPHYLKWGYSLEKPTVEYLMKEFKIDLTASRKYQTLDWRYIYIHATSIAQNLRKDKLISSDDDPIYFNVNGDVIFPPYDKTKTIIETIFRIDIEKTPNDWLEYSLSTQVKPKISIDRGMIKFYHQPIYIATNGLIRVLVAYQKNIDSNRATEIAQLTQGIGSVVKPTSTLYTINSNQLV